MELDLKRRITEALGTTAGGTAPGQRETVAGHSAIPIGSFRADRRGTEQVGANPPERELVSWILGRLEEHPHFRGRTAHLSIELVHGRIVVTGRVPSYYLKQLLQEAIKAIPRARNIAIDNRLIVMYPGTE